MKVKICGIYKITSPSGRAYVGQSIDIISRFKSYFNVSNKTLVLQRRLYRSLKKYKPENHIFEVIKECKREYLDKWEIFYIKKLDLFDSDKGLNIRSGGSRGRVSKETKQRISKSLKGIKRSPEFCKQISERQRGIDNPAYGTKISEKHKEILRYHGKKKVFTEEYRKKLSDAMKGNTNGSKRINTKHSEETRLKMSLAKKGKPNGRKNIFKHSDSTKQKISNSVKKFYKIQDGSRISKVA